MAGCGEDRNIVRVRGKGFFQSMGPKHPRDQYRTFTGISYASLCIVVQLE